MNLFSKPNYWKYSEERSSSRNIELLKKDLSNPANLKAAKKEFKELSNLCRTYYYTPNEVETSKAECEDWFSEKKDGISKLKCFFCWWLVYKLTSPEEVHVSVTHSITSDGEIQ